VKRYLGIDFGEKRVGIAISDPTLTLAQPLQTLHYTSVKKLILNIQDMVKEKEIEKIVLGLPLNLKGKDSLKTKDIRKFAEKLKSQLNIPILLVDERFTTKEAQRILKQLGRQSSKRRDIVDQIAAQHILQTYLDREKQLGGILRS
jgi:putative Holliday junction resolvase